MRDPRVFVALAFAAAVLACSSDDTNDVVPIGGEPAERMPDAGMTGDAMSPRITGPCTLATDVTPSFEERRLESRLPGKQVPFATELLEGTGFAGFAGDFAKELCDGGIAGASSLEEARTLVRNAGTRLWTAATARVQGRTPIGTLPAGDDRMLYWARLTMTKTLRGWAPFFGLSDGERADLEWELERASRGQYEIAFPPGDVARILISGFDPFSLGAPGAVDEPNVKIGNPSGAAMLAFDGLELTLEDGKKVHVETYLLPVSYGPFERGMQEDTLGPWFKEGPTRIAAAITTSQGGGYQFELEEWNGRYHGELEGNDGVATCQGTVRLPNTPGCNILPPERWTSTPNLPWQKDQPPQFTRTSLPIGAAIGARTGEKVARPPGSLASPGNAFDVFWSTDFTAFQNCAVQTLTPFNDPPPQPYPPPTLPTAPPSGSCAKRGSGGDYLSNESAYRATLLRDSVGQPPFVGHLHLPVMTRFDPGHESLVTDAKFEAYRTAIVAQSRLLLEAIAREL